MHQNEASDAAAAVESDQEQPGADDQDAHLIDLGDQGGVLEDVDTEVESNQVD